MLQPDFISARSDAVREAGLLNVLRHWTNDSMVVNSNPGVSEFSIMVRPLMPRLGYQKDRCAGGVNLSMDLPT